MRKYIFKSSLRFQNGLKNSLILQFSLQLHAKQYFEIFFRNFDKKPNWRASLIEWKTKVVCSICDKIFPGSKNRVSTVNKAPKQLR